MSETTTTSRVLSLLNLLQTHRHWSGPALAERLGVTTRTLRRDVDRLRGLGYRVASLPGTAGGYQLEPGAALPPLLLTDDEAVTMAIGLRLAAVQGLVDGVDTTLAALAKLEQVLPSALRGRVNALGAHLQPIRRDLPAVSPELLGQLALVCRDRERIRFRYTAADGAETDRLVEPYDLVASERRWYLVAWDLRREDWRTFRVDRLDRFAGTRVRYAPRMLPEDHAAELVAIAVAQASIVPVLRLDAVLDWPVERMREYAGVWARDAEDAGEGRTRWPLAGEHYPDLIYGLLWIPPGIAYDLEGDPEVVARVREIAERMLGR